MWRERDAPDWRSAAIEGSHYTSSARFADERRRIFSRTWQLAGRLEQLSEPGDYLTCEVAGESVLVDTGNFRAGGTVTVTVRCVSSMHDVAFVGVPGTRTFTARSVEVIDTYRGEDGS